MSTLEKAKRNYKAWHQKDFDDVITESYAFPDKVFYAGRMEYMVYESDKWEDDGDFYFYEHDFDSRPSFYVPRRARSFLPSKYRFRRTPRLLCVDDILGDVPLTALAIVIEMLVDGSEGRQKFVFKEPPVLAGTPDNKTLVIFSDKGPLFVSGAKMRVTERGIVH